MRRATDLFRIKGERTILEGGKRRLDFAVPLIDVNKNRATYTRAVGQKTTLPFDLTGRTVTLATTRVDEPIAPTATTTAFDDPGFEAQIAAYLKQTESWAPSDRPEPFERHLFRKRQRAKQFRGEGAP